MSDNNGKWPVIGIDLGTTNSCAAVWQNDRVEIIPNDRGNRTTPSCVAFTDSERLTGEAAVRQAIRNPLNTIFDVKRLIGTRYSDTKVQGDIKLWPFNVIELPGDAEKKPVIKVSGTDEDKHYSPEEMSAMILAKMKESAEVYLKTTVTNAVITVPAYFNDSQRQATKDAGLIAGLNVLRIINEPTAAVFAYGLHRKITNRDAKRNVLVFDLGGGTFDVSLVCMEKNSFEVISVGGDTHLGGVDFDNNMVENFIEEFKRIHNVDIRTNSKSLGKLRKACEEAKKTLSTNLQTSIDIDCLYEGVDFSCSITRATFEILNMNLFERIMKPVDLCLRDAKVGKSDVDDIVLVGGSTRIPKIQQLVQEFFDGKELCRDINPDEAVAHGAAVQAALMAGVCDKKNILLYDVAPLSLGIQIYNGEMMIVVPRNTTIPTSKVTKVTTFVDNVTEVVFNVYEGERPRAIDNNFLGTFILFGFSPAPKGVPKFDVWFDIDANGILTASAEEVIDDVSVRVKNEITIINQSRFSKEEVDRLIEEALKCKAEDARHLRKVTAINALQNYAFETWKTLSDNKDKLRSEEMIKIKDELEKAVEWVNWNNHLKDASKYEKKLKEMKDFYEPIVANVSKSTSVNPFTACFTDGSKPEKSMMLKDYYNPKIAKSFETHAWNIFPQEEMIYLENGSVHEEAQKAAQEEVQTKRQGWSLQLPRVERADKRFTMKF